MHRMSRVAPGRRSEDEYTYEVVISPDNRAIVVQRPRKRWLDPLGWMGQAHDMGRLFLSWRAALVLLRQRLVRSVWLGVNFWKGYSVGLLIVLVFCAYKG
jgi:hypothetical protein